MPTERRYYLTYLLGLMGLLLCAHLLLLSGLDGADCLGREKPPAAGAGLFNCQLAKSADPLAGSGLSLALVGFVYWIVLLVALYLRLLPGFAARLSTLLRPFSLLAAIIACALVAWQFTDTGRICPLCLIDALLALAAAGLLWPRHRSGPRAVLRLWPHYQLGLFAAMLAGALGYLSLHRSAATPPIDSARFYELLTREIEPAYLEEMAPCGFTGEVERLPVEQFYTAADHIDGPPDAPVQLTILFDPSCPACRHLNRAVSTVRQAFADNDMADQLAVRQIPLVLYRETIVTTQALWLLRGTAEFTRLKDTLSAEDAPTITQLDDLAALLDQLGIDHAALVEQIREGAGREELLQTTGTTIELGLDSLPQVLVNDRLLSPSRRNRTADCLARVLLDQLQSSPDNNLQFEIITE